MSEFKGTPGPWSVHEFANYQGFPTLRGAAIETESVRVAVVSGAVVIDGSRYDEHTANARLIAAAPGLLEALMLAKRMIDLAHPKFNWGASFLDADAIRLLNEAPIAVNAAIAKALGHDATA